MSFTATPSSPIYMDISRLLSRAGMHVPTGIDRVEYEYAIYLQQHWSGPLTFVAYHPVHGICPIDRQKISHFLGLTAALWDGKDINPSTLKWMARRLILGISLYKNKIRTPNNTSSGIYLLLSHHHLMRAQPIERFLKKTRTRLAVMIHDIIPLEFPEYSRPGEDKRHLKRLDTVRRLAKTIIVPTQSVRSSLAPYMPPETPIHVVAHGLHIWGVDRGTDILPQNPHGKPFFVCIGTIEPRKNHLLLLNIWRDMAHHLGKETPELVIIGRRGWENENVIDMLERCPILQKIVTEYNNMDDQQVIACLRRARALLFPSFTEGFGLPLLEAMAVRTPIICSDLPVLREVAGSDALYIDPTDGPAWKKAIMDLMKSVPVTEVENTRTSSPVSPWPDQVRLGLAALHTEGP